MIFSPSDSPYMGGIYEFDIEFPPTYPSVPPLVTFRTTAGGRVRFNPNLYACGKVCLSLLGTWSGEKWIPNTSTLLQVRQYFIPTTFLVIHIFFWSCTLWV